jgi:CRISPR-associated endonuclease Csn1
VKSLERFRDKKEHNPNMKYSPQYDGISCEENLVLYDYLIEKMKTGKYDKRPGNPNFVLQCGRDAFKKLDIWKQAECLMQIIQVFSRKNPCDFASIGGAKNAAKCRISLQLKSLNSTYRDIRIIDQSASGLFEIPSVNLLDLL